MEIRPLSADRLGDLGDLFGTNAVTAGCYCMWFLVPVKECHAGWGEPNRRAFESFAAGADPPAGLLAYRDGEPVGWCALGPRSRYARMLRSRLLAGREPAEDDGVWLVPCLFVRRTARRQGITVALLQAAVGLARAAGITAVEGLPYADGARRSPGDAFVGVAAMFRASGFTEVRPVSKVRVLMRHDLAAGDG